MPNLHPKHLSTFLLLLVSSIASAMEIDRPPAFDGLSRGEVAAACQLRFAGNVDFLLKLADSATAQDRKRSLTGHAFSAGAMSILAGESATLVSPGLADRVRRLGTFDAGPTGTPISAYCLSLYYKAALQRGQDANFQMEVAKLVQRIAHERYLAAGGIPKYADEPLLPGGFKGIALGITASDAVHQLQSQYPGSKVNCLPIASIQGASHCHVMPAPGAELNYANIRASEIMYYIFEQRVAAFMVVYPPESAKSAFTTLETNLRRFAPVEPQATPPNIDPTTFITWRSGQELLQLQSDANGTYFTYGVESHLIRALKATMPAIQSERGM